MLINVSVMEEIPSYRSPVPWMSSSDPYQNSAPGPASPRPPHPEKHLNFLHVLKCLKEKIGCVKGKREILSSATVSTNH